MSVYAGLFITAFLAATIVPAYSEVLLLALLAKGYEPGALWAVATLGNTLGALVNWMLGRFMLRYQDRSWFPFELGKLGVAQKWFSKYGVWSLLFAWAPVGGDALTFIAGFMRVSIVPFLLLTGVGKGLRYAFVIALAQTLMPY